MEEEGCLDLPSHLASKVERVEGDCLVNKQALVEGCSAGREGQLAEEGYSRDKAWTNLVIPLKGCLVCCVCHYVIIL